MRADEIAWVVVSALGLAVMAAVTARAAQRGAPYARLCALGMALGALTLGAALLAVALGAEGDATGRFLVGMGVGVALGMALGGAIILVASRHAA